MPSTNQPAPLVTIGLDFVVGDHGPYDEDGEPAGQVTIGDRIVDAAVQEIVRQAGKDIRAQVSKAVREQITAQAEQHVAEAFAKPFKKTDTWGQPNGQETSIAALIGEQVQDWITKADNNYDRGASPFRKLLAEEVNKAMRAELVDTIKTARAQVEDVVKNNAAQMIADAVKASTK